MCLGVAGSEYTGVMNTLPFMPGRSVAPPLPIPGALDSLNHGLSLPLLVRSKPLLHKPTPPSARTRGDAVVVPQSGIASAKHPSKQSLTATCVCRNKKYGRNPHILGESLA
eukprot:362460-Chlamydomonas_euryale.AAC.1